MEITGMLYILPMVVLQVEAYLYYKTINKTILSFLDVCVAERVLILFHSSIHSCVPWY